MNHDTQIDKNGEHLEVYNVGYRMGRDLEKMVMYVESDPIKYNNKKVVIL